MKTEPGTSPKKRKLTTAAMLAGAIACAVLIAISFGYDKLYTPFGILAPNDGTPNFYFGIAIYISIGTTLFTSAIIRIALDLSK